jgi:hypothetical protein
MNQKDPQQDAAPSQRPRSPRVPVEFALEVEGNDSAGNPFRAKATATKISRGGATLLLDVDLALGSVITLIPPFGGTLEGEVNGSWVDEIDGRQRVGVKLTKSDGWFAQ